MLLGEGHQLPCPSCLTPSLPVSSCPLHPDSALASGGPLPGLLGWASAHLPWKTPPAALRLEGVVDALPEAPPGVPRAKKAAQGHELRLHLFSPLDSLPFHVSSVAAFSSTGVSIRPPSSHTAPPRPMRLRTKPSRSRQVGEPTGHPAPWTPAKWSVILALAVAA